MSGRVSKSRHLPFSLAVIIDGAVFRREAPALLAFHDDDGCWQFLSGRPTSVDDAKIVGLGEILQLDPTLREILDTPRGHVAIRDAWGESWRIELSAAYLDKLDLSLN
ncbi:MAG: hypothetical protein J0H41_10860 [Rhizobiales bacterium]|nr:hypothetical protein [Hyphomicrobiales bacterium]